MSGKLGMLPILGVCGLSGAGKTTLIESIMPDLRARGLKTAVVKHGCHHLTVDRPGKDTDRFFRAGADVFAFGEERFSRLHDNGNPAVLESQLNQLAEHYDLILIEGHSRTPVEKIWLLKDNHEAVPEQVLMTLERGSDWRAQCLSFIDNWLIDRHKVAPVYACVLIGGRSSRMGRPKHLLSFSPKKIWLEQIVDTVVSVVDGVVLSGRGEVSDSLAHLPRISDIPDLQGPMTGLLAAMRSLPRCSWILIGCDMPAITPEALSWLRQHHGPGVWGVLPRLGAGKTVEPLLALYDWRCRHLVEDLALTGNQRIRMIAEHEKIARPEVPEQLRTAWQNINTPEELGVYRQHSMS